MTIGSLVIINLFAPNSLFYLKDNFETLVWKVRALLCIDEEQYFRWEFFFFSYGFSFARNICS